MIDTPAIEQAALRGILASMSQRLSVDQLLELIQNAARLTDQHGR